MEIWSLAPLPQLLYFGCLVDISRYDCTYHNPEVDRIWVVVKITVPFWVLSIIRNLGDPKGDHNFDNHPYGVYKECIMIRRSYPIYSRISVGLLRPKRLRHLQRMCSQPRFKTRPGNFIIWPTHTALGKQLRYCRAERLRTGRFTPL